MWGKYNDKDNPYNHKSKHQEVKYGCDQCESSFTERWTLSKHKQSKHKRVGNDNRCEGSFTRREIMFIMLVLKLMLMLMLTGVILIIMTFLMDVKMTGVTITNLDLLRGFWKYMIHGYLLQLNPNILELEGHPDGCQDDWSHHHQSGFALRFPKIYDMLHLGG